MWSRFEVNGRLFTMALVALAWLMAACSGSGPADTPADSLLPPPDSAAVQTEEPQGVGGVTVVVTPVVAAGDTAEVPRLVERASGKAAKDFELTLFDGETLRLSDLKGKVVVLNFWASYCVPCRWEMPAFEAMWQEFKDEGVVFVGVAVGDTEEDAIAFAEQVGATYPLGLDTSGEITIDYSATKLPSTYLIDSDGNEARKFGVANEAVLRIFLKGQLRGG